MMKKIAEIKAPKVVVDFIVHQSTDFIASKEFKKRVTDFIFNAVDDVVTMVYNNSKSK